MEGGDNNRVCKSGWCKGDYSLHLMVLLLGDACTNLGDGGGVVKWKEKRVNGGGHTKMVDRKVMTRCDDDVVVFGRVGTRVMVAQ